jgi:Cytochrome c554 and c-prime
MIRQSATTRWALLCAAAFLAFPAPSPAPLPTRPQRPPSEEPPGVATPSEAVPGVATPGMETPGPVPRAAADPLAGPGLSYSAGQYLGPGSCSASGCHGNAAPGRIYAILQNEWSVWNHEDKHRHAFDPLWSAKAARIVRNLGLSRRATETALCLDCHVLRAPAAAQAIPLEVADGISCEGCHGPAGGWLARHNETGWTHADSLAAGMIDLRQPRKRARLCLGCHQGDRGRQVDHELLAAGHPELVFELDNYTESMPAHWLPYAERGDRGEGGDSHGLRAWAVGQVESFRAGLELLNHRAAAGQWPEFAEMTCDSCHHDLAGGAWRQERGYRHRAGMPAWSVARYAVLRHLLAKVAPAAELAELDASVDAVAAAVANLRDPPQRLSAASQRAAAALAAMNARVDHASWSGQAASNLLAAILADRNGAPGADRQSAEQTALAIQSITAHLATTQPRLGRGKPNRLVRQLFGELDQPHGYDRERFVELLGELEAELE